MATKTTNKDDFEEVLKDYTVGGITVSVNPKALDDLDFVEDLGRATSGESTAAFAFPKLMRRVLGDEQYARVKEALREDYGRVPLAKSAEWLMNLLGEIDPN